MAKNILIFSDGTGQAGGLRPNQRLSNVHKLYRATRIGPDSTINPAQQIAFYDAGLGSDEIQGPVWGQLVKVIRKFLSSAFGTGFTENVADCYEYVLSVYEPGDRIFLIGFSRGSYTVRSVAGVMNLCGVPIKDENGDPIPRGGKTLRKIVDEAVHTVYEHGAGRQRLQFEPEREEQARRFRIKYGTQDDPVKNIRGDVVPYFIGVFDTVAALGSTGIKKVIMIAITAFVSAAVALGISWVVSWLFDWSLWIVSLAVMAAALIGFGIFSYRVRVKVIHDFPNPGETRRHWSGWHFQHYDRFLDKRVRYARHAQAIDETRTDFARVGWGRLVDQKDAPEDWLVQMWFAGNHSDIGGSYPETESRLSDIALEWMAREAEKIPDGMILDWSKLHVFPDPSGMQHCEVTAVRDLYPSWLPARWRFSWREQPRPDITLEACHPTVLERMKLNGISKCCIQQLYRPIPLRNDPALAAYYAPAASVMALGKTAGPNKSAG
jgi:uncharacterized protein (DUF2235 family)